MLVRRGLSPPAKACNYYMEASRQWRTRLNRQALATLFGPCRGPREADPSTLPANNFPRVDKCENPFSPLLTCEAWWAHGRQNRQNVAGTHTNRMRARRLPTIFRGSTDVRTGPFIGAVDANLHLHRTSDGPTGGWPAAVFGGVTRRDSRREGFGRRRGKCVGQSAR